MDGNKDQNSIIPGHYRAECCVFSELEINDIRRSPGMMKLIIVLFIVIVVMIFMPYSSMNSLSKEVGQVGILLKERHSQIVKRQEKIEKRLEQLEREKPSLDKKIYWINRNSRETNEGIQALAKLLADLKILKRE